MSTTENGIQMTVCTIDGKQVVNLTGGVRQNAEIVENMVSPCRKDLVPIALARMSRLFQSLRVPKPLKVKKRRGYYVKK